MTTPRTSSTSDAGFSLIELIVAILVTSIILSAASVILFNSWRAQEEVRSVTGATNQGQIIGSMIERAVRNAENLEVTANEIKVWTSYDGTSLRCQGFRITSGDLRVATAQTTLPTTFPDWDPHLAIGGSGPFFSKSGDDVVSYAFDLKTEGSTIRISGQSQPRSLLKSGDGGCW